MLFIVKIAFQGKFHKIYDIIPRKNLGKQGDQIQEKSHDWDSQKGIQKNHLLLRKRLNFKEGKGHQLNRKIPRKLCILTWNVNLER